MIPAVAGRAVAPRPPGGSQLAAAVWRAAILAAPIARSPRDRRLDRDFGKMYEPKFPIAAQP